MRSKLGTILMVLGCLMIAAAVALLLHNEAEQQRAAAASAEAIPKVVEAIQQRAETQVATLPTASDPEKEMSVVQIDGYGYIGFLGMPAIGLELPVMTDWSYPQLQIAPCRYTGSTYTDDLVIMAHNYEKHFGKLSKLFIGDIITFTDMDAETTQYKVVAEDILDPTAVEELTAGEYDLTLFTCTYGGENRVVLRCDRVRNG